MMKFAKALRLPLSLILFYCTACDGDRKPILRNEEFEFDRKLGKHVLFLYSRQPENDTIFTELRFVGNDSVISRTYTLDYDINEVKWKLNGQEMELVSNSYFIPDESGNQKRIAGKIIRAEGIPGKYHGASTVTEYVESLTKRTEDTFNQTYTGDTTFFWNGKQIPAIKFEIQSTAITVNRLLPVSRSEMKFSGATFFAKGLGFVGEYFTSDTLEDGTVFSASYWLVGIERLD